MSWVGYILVLYLGIGVGYIAASLLHKSVNRMNLLESNIAGRSYRHSDGQFEIGPDDDAFEVLRYEKGQRYSQSTTEIENT